jgi:hypothetical protein
MLPVIDSHGIIITGYSGGVLILSDPAGGNHAAEGNKSQGIHEWAKSSGAHPG